MKRILAVFFLGCILGTALVTSYAENIPGEETADISTGQTTDAVQKDAPSAALSDRETLPRDAGVSKPKDKNLQTDGADLKNTVTGILIAFVIAAAVIWLILFLLPRHDKR